MNRYFTVMLLAASLALTTPSASQANEGDISFSLNAGSLTFDKDEHLETGPVIGARLGYDLHRNLGLEGSFGFADTRSDVTAGKPQAYAYTYRADLLYYLLPESALSPFLTVGSGIMNLNGSTTWGNRTSLLLEYGLGIKYFLSDNLALRGDARNLWTFDNNRHSHLEFTGSINYYFSRKNSAAMKEVVPAAKERQPVLITKTLVSPAVANKDNVAERMSAPDQATRDLTTTQPANQLPKVVAPAAVAARQLQKDETVKIADMPSLAVKSIAKAAPAQSGLPITVTVCSSLKEITKVITIQNGFEIVANSPIDIPTAITLTNPTRLALDISCATNSSGSKALKVNHRGALQVRIGSYPDKLRVVFDFDQPAVPAYRVEKTGHGLKVIF